MKKNNTLPRKKTQQQTAMPSWATAICPATGEDVETHPAWVRLALAIEEIVTNDATPTCLREPVMDFLTTAASGGVLDKLMKSPPVIVKILVAASMKEELEEESEGVQ